MNTMLKRVISLMLCIALMTSCLPVSVLAAESEDTLTASLKEAKDYINGLTIDSSANDPEKVVKKFKTHFTWDNEKREESKTYLFDWSYYNGVVFEGLEYVYEATGDEVYKDYVVEYMSSMINDNGTWATCSNNPSKYCAGYNSTHGADCYKTASLLLDTYDMTGDNRYLTMADTLYADLNTAAKSYLLPNAGNNYRHTWASDSTPDLWLDGLYMILPFRAEYAKYIGDKEELDLIVDRMQWVSNNMYNGSKGLFYHAADSATSNSGTHWLRSIGWYAAAIVDVMDSMEGENLETMKAQLVKLVDGMKACQNTSNGMWLNNMNASQSSSNPYETSGTALVCYAVMKAVNNGWLDESYADMALLAFNGICSEKLSNNKLNDICFKGAPGSSNSTFYADEGKGVGPFIMLYAEILEYVNAEEDTPEVETPEVLESIDGLTISGEKSGITNVTATKITDEDALEAMKSDLEATDLIAFDLSGDFTGGAKATVTIAVPESWQESNLAVYHVDGEKYVKYEDCDSDPTTYTFVTDHFSTWALARAATNSGTAYTLDTDGVDNGAKYIIASGSNGEVNVLTNDNVITNSTATVSDGTISVENDSNIAWTVTVGTDGKATFSNNGQNLAVRNANVYLDNDDTDAKLYVSHQGNGAYRIHKDNARYYLRYKEGEHSDGSGGWGLNWGMPDSVCLFKVSEKTVQSVTLENPIGIVYVNSADTVVTGAKIKVTYSDNSTETVDVTVDMLTDSDGKPVSTVAAGRQTNLKVTYNDEVISQNFVLNVIATSDMDYPEYPDPGSVQVDKYIADYSQFQDLGVAEVNLTTSGLPLQTGVDVILVTDLSNSMAREVGIPQDGSYNHTKMHDLQDAVESFADTFLGDNDQNTISLVTFGGYDKEHTKKVYTSYADPTQTLLVGSDSANAVKEKINNIQLRYNKELSTDFDLSFDGGKTWGENYGNTNYDYAFMETYSAVNALKAQYEATHQGITYAESGREIYILFMTDGAPSNYNGYYYNYQTGDRADVNATWTDSDREKTYQMGVNNAKYSQESWYQLIRDNPLGWATKVSKIPGVEEIIPVGFDLANGGFAKWAFTTASGYPLKPVLENLVQDKTLSVEQADTSGELTEIYAKLASKWKMAATKAYFVDQMGSSFDLQRASTITKFEGTSVVKTEKLDPAPKITVSTRSVYAANMEGKEIGGVKVTKDMVGKPYGSSKIVETVTFSDDGSKAYSDKIGTATTDIMQNGVICAKTFWYNTNGTDVMIDTDGDGELDYNLPAETFYWKIGTINNEQFILSYYVYLEGSAQGEAEAGTYPTNNYATLYYTNWLGNPAQKDVETPTLAWESASVYYGFYLVDQNGEPVVNRATGQTGSFKDAVKVTTKIFYDEVHLNAIGDISNIRVASNSVPDEYTVYDGAASYKIIIDSDTQGISGWQITKGKDENGNDLPFTTYVTDYKGNEFTNKLESEGDAGFDYTSTTVWFAVVWEPKTVPDVVVIDYGLPVSISVLENDMLSSSCVLTGVGAIADKPEEVEYSNSKSGKFTAEYKGTAYGDVSMEGRKAIYTPDTMSMPTYDSFAYEALYETSKKEKQYYYGDVTVIPATVIYYEDSFVSYADGEVAKDTTLSKEDSNGTLYGKWSNDVPVNANQAEDRPGMYSLIDANNLYGYDQAYEDCITYSLGSAKKVTVSKANNPNTTYSNPENPNGQGGEWPTATFTFTGTGFDIISSTSNNTGLINVKVYKGAKVTNKDNYVANWAVDTYYSYVYDETTGQWTVWEPAENKQPDGTNSLYQIPVIKSGDALKEGKKGLNGEDLGYGTYTVVITPMYSSKRDHGGGALDYDFYLDAIRIYEPANDGVNGEDKTIQNAYTMDNEAWPSFSELRNMLIAKDKLSVSNKVTGIVFIDGDSEVTDTPEQIADYYVPYGPNNEVYLAPNQAVAFKLATDSTVADVQIAMKSADGRPVNAEWYNAKYIKENGTVAAKNVVSESITTSTDMYYSFYALRDDVNNIDDNNDAIVIRNTGGGILSITNVKVTYKENPNSTGSAPNVASYFQMSEESANLAVKSLSLRSMPEVEEPTVFVPETFTIAADKQTVKQGQNVKVTVKASSDVESVVINGEKAKEGKVDKKTGLATWTASLKATEAGSLVIAAVAYDVDGVESDPIGTVVTVTAKKAPGGGPSVGGPSSNAGNSGTAADGWDDMWQTILKKFALLMLNLGGMIDNEENVQ